VASSYIFAVFHGAHVFNSDVSKWSTGAVTTMQQSKCCDFLCYILTFTNCQFSHLTVFYVVLECYFVGVGVVFFVLWFVLFPFLCCCTLSFAVFNLAKAFNQDVSKWSTGAVTNMYGSKCILLFHRPLSVASVLFF